MQFKAGTDVELDIGDVAYGGRGVGRVESGGMAVFVPGTLVGERVKARILKVHKRFAEAELMEVLTPSVARCQPACPLAGRCGGCVYQHAPLALELDLKHRQFQSLLRRIGGLTEVSVLDPIPSPNALGYRNKMVLHAGPDGELGYVCLDRKSIIDVECCPLVNAQINHCLKSQRTDSNWREQLSYGDKVAFRWTRHDGVVFWKNAESGGGTLTEDTPFGCVQVPRDGFFQVNPSMFSIMVETVGKWVDDVSPEYLIDLYCGCGVFALQAAQSGIPHVLGVEVNGQAIRVARKNARQLKHAAVKFVEGDAGMIFPDAIDRVDASRTLVLADPPREGLSGHLLSKICEHAPDALLYVSCAPDTLARDAKILDAGGYHVIYSQILDMFPRTAHFETITLLRRK